MIAHFFDYCSMPSYREYVQIWIEAVHKNDYWRHDDPATLIFYYKELSALIKAVYLIYKEKRMGKTAIDLLKGKGYDVEANLMHPALYVGRYRKYTLWDYFPRNLSLKEYIDPYLVFPRFFEMYDPDGWLHELEGLLSSGLSKYSSKFPGKIF